MSAQLAVECEAVKTCRQPAAASCLYMMGSWRYIPAVPADQMEDSRRLRSGQVQLSTASGKCPLCGHKTRPTSQLVKSSRKSSIQNFPLLRNKSTGHIASGEHQRLGRSADVSQLWSSPSLIALRLNRSSTSDIYDETYNRYGRVTVEN